MKTIFARIQSSDQSDPGATGKTSKVAVYYSDITIEGKWLRLTALDSVRRGTGERGGRAKTTNRRLTLEFNAEALEDLFNRALSAGLFQPKGVERLALAQRHLDSALKQLGHSRRPKKQPRST
jgi:hypothetical protein